MSPTWSRKPLVLIVDDNPANLGVLVELLTRQDLEVSIAEDGESALDQAEDVRPDLILLDVMMPEMDGFTTCRRTRLNRPECMDERLPKKAEAEHAMAASILETSHPR